MSVHKLPHNLAATLREAAAAYQNAHVIQHCARCAKPCCRLDVLVLELGWKQVKAFWRINQSRALFDQRLAAGDGPAEIRAGDGRYYVHTKTCPAYDATHRSCRVYGQALKPVGCTDFPVYEDGDCVIADLRCEAVDITVLADGMARAVGAEFRISQSADQDFPFLVTLSVMPAVASLPARPAAMAR